MSVSSDNLYTFVANLPCLNKWLTLPEWWLTFVGIFNVLLKLEDPLLEGRFHAGNPAYSDNRFEVLKTLIDGYVNELENPKNHLTRYLLWKEYRMSYPTGYGYSQFCYHLSQHQTARHPGMVLSSEPADKLLIDFAGDTLAYVDLTTGELINCQVFVACLKHTDYSFAMAVHTHVFP